MSMLRSVTVGAVATAMLATSVTPAMAQGHSGGYGGSGYGRPGYSQGYNNNRYRQYRHRKDDNTGAVVAGVIGLGILAAIIASASKSKNSVNGAYGSIRTDDQAADACAVAAERRIGGDARTRSIDTVDQVSGGFNVRGTLATAYAGSNDRGYDEGGARSFTCTVRQGNVQRVDFGGYAYNY